MSKAAKELLISAAALGLLAVACGAPPQAVVDFGAGKEFVPQVADFQDNVGVDPTVAIGSDGSPYVAYFGFPSGVRPNKVAPPRPVLAPFVPSVLLTSLQKGVYVRGAVAMAKPAPTGVVIPFGPAEVPGLQNITPQSVNGTDIAISSTGAMHVVWAGADGYWYGSSPDGKSFSAQRIFSTTTPLSTAGPLGMPSIALDTSGTPWVAFTQNVEGGESVRVGRPVGATWTFEDAAAIRQCPGCPQPEPTGIAFDAGGAPVVAYADTGAGAVMAATFDGTAWTTREIERADATGLSATSGKGGVVHVTYYTKDEVHEASLSNGAWTVSSVAKYRPKERETGLGTDLAVDDQGTVYVTWKDPSANRVMLVSGSGGTFTTIETSNTAGGQNPSVGVTPDGSFAYLAWYDRWNQNLQLATYGDVSGLGLLLANPSPTPNGIPSVAPTAQCAPSGTRLQLTAPAGAATNGFAEKCLAVDAGKAFTVDFNNQDSIAHNMSIYTDSSGTTSIQTQALDLTLVSKTVTYNFDAIAKPGTYFFRCDFHPTAMTGAFIVK